MASGDQTNYFVHALLRARDWQHRPQFDQVCDWWRGGGRGVCALVGMGGAGKTAIAERFLRTLPGGLPEDPDVAKDESLPKPRSTFVFSFYDAPNPEAFFEALQMWLERTPRVESVLSVGQLLFLLQQTPGLMLLDGLEKVQDDGSRGVFGRLTSPKLRDFLDHLAGGYVPQLSVLVTSRFPLADLRDAHPQFFRRIPVDQIGVATGIQLLRDRGVHGSDLQLERIVEECGKHALTVDLAGGYIKEYGQGDPATPLNLGTAEELQAEAEQEPDDARRAVLKQAFRFARIGARYREAMLNNDEAGIALLERICLFRLGVDCETLAAIFTGPDATKVSGEALAGLDANQLQKKLDWLVRTRIVEESQSSSSLKTEKAKTLYSIHPAVRDGFLSGIGRKAAEASHEAVRKGLEVSLGDAPGKKPSDRITLDVLEEIVFHATTGRNVNEGWDIYLHRIGGSDNLLRLGAYERGERICRSFASGTPPRNAHDLPEFSCHEHVGFYEDWGFYLRELGQLNDAVECFKRSIEFALLDENSERARDGDLCLAYVYVATGNLLRLQESCNKVLSFGDIRKAEAVDGPVFTDTWELSFSFLGHFHTLRGEIKKADAAFRTFRVAWKKSHGDDPELWFFGIWHRQFLIRLGRVEEATVLAGEHRDYAIDDENSFESDVVCCDLIKAELALRAGDQSGAVYLEKECHNWAIAHDAKELLCWSALVQARIELSEHSAVGHQPSNQDSERAQRLTTAVRPVAKGLKIARDCGFSLYHIDLLLERARVHLLQGNPKSALEDIELGLDNGIPVNDQTGQPELLAANHEECGYAWPIPAGLHLRGEAQLLTAAQQLDSDSFVPAKRDELPDEVQTLIESAESNLNEALAKWQPLHDPQPEREDQNFKHPETGDEYNFRAADTYRVLERLEGGLLTDYPLESVSPTKSTENLETPEKTKGTKPMPKKHVFLSYCHDNKTEVARLRDDLIADGEVVWWDQDILGGQDWKLEIRKAMRDAYAVVVCLSAETADRITSGVYPEVLDAIAAYREHAPGGIFLIPLRLSKCEIPLIEIDATRTLDRLQYIDLFSSNGLAELVKSLKASALHP